MVQRGAIDPLIKLVKSQDVELQEFSAFALGLLAQVISPNHLFFWVRLLSCSIYYLGEEQRFITSLFSLMLACLRLLGLKNQNASIVNFWAHVM